MKESLQYSAAGTYFTGCEGRSVGGGFPVLLIVDEVCANGHDVPVWESCVLGMGLLCV